MENDYDNNSDVDKQKILGEEKPHSIMKQIIDFLSNKYSSNNIGYIDISYKKWVENNQYFKTLCSEFEIPLPLKSETNIDYHDFDCEFKLLQWITNTISHRDNFLSIPLDYTYRNRYDSIIPYQFNTVYFSSSSSIENYINASFINVPLTNAPKFIIATQNPLRETIDHFWKMILSHNVTFILMISGKYEENRVKADCYWPNEGEIIEQEDYTIQNELETPIFDNILSLKKLKVINKLDNEIRDIDHLHIESWNENEVLPEEDTIMKLYDVLFNYLDLSTASVIHCNNGTGRTGTIIALYYLYQCFKEQKKLSIHNPLMNVFNVVRCLREQRIGMVNDAKSYQYIYHMALAFIKAIFK